MNYPIFSAIVNHIEDRLARRTVNIDQFRVWNEDKINATGLEIGIDLTKKSDQVKRLMINLDWDKFREAGLAKQLPGMKKHPLLKSNNANNKRLSPYIDVETIWYFDEKVLYKKLDSPVGNRRIEAASQWMEFINKEVKRILTEDNLISRWHVEVEGDLHGRFVSNMNLISYLQYRLEDFTSLNDIHIYLDQNLQKIFLRTDSIIKIASRTFEFAA